MSETKKWAVDWMTFQKTDRPKLIKTTACPNCKYNTRSHYDDGTEWCGMCFTFSYPITIKKENENEK